MGMLDDDLETPQARRNAARLRNGGENLSGPLPADAEWEARRCYAGCQGECRCDPARLRAPLLDHPAILKRGAVASTVGNRSTAQQSRDAVAAAAVMAAELAKPCGDDPHALTANCLTMLSNVMPDDVADCLRRLFRK